MGTWALFRASTMSYGFFYSNLPSYLPSVNVSKGSIADPLFTFLERKAVAAPACFISWSPCLDSYCASNVTDKDAFFSLNDSKPLLSPPQTFPVVLSDYFHSC